MQDDLVVKSFEALGVSILLLLLGLVTFTRVETQVNGGYTTWAWLTACVLLAGFVVAFVAFVTILVRTVETRFMLFFWLALVFMCYFLFVKALPQGDGTIPALLDDTGHLLVMVIVLVYAIALRSANLPSKPAE